MKEITNRSDCPISYSLDFLGDKWTLLILRDIIFGGKSTYGEFLSSKEKMATNILADRLSMLESNGFLNKQIGEDKKSKFVYTMTEKGIELIPLIMELTIWGSKFNPPGNASLVKELKKNKTGTIKAYQDKLREKIAKES